MSAQIKSQKSKIENADGILIVDVNWQHPFGSLNAQLNRMMTCAFPISEAERDKMMEKLHAFCGQKSE